MDKFNQSVAVITGGASGIGLAVAKALAAEGARLVLADIERSALDAAVKDLRDSGAEAEGVVVDVSDRAAYDPLVEATSRRFGGADFVMLNAGVVAAGKVQDLSLKDWTWAMQVNLWGVINGVDAFLPQMLERGREGHFVLTSSFAGLAPNRERATYNVTKAGVVALAESMNQDLHGTPVSTSVLCPMMVTSQIYTSSRNRPSELGGAEAARPRGVVTGDARVLPAEAVAQLVLEGVRRKSLYIQTHKEGEKYVAKRFTRIQQSFETAT